MNTPAVYEELKVERSQWERLDLLYSRPSFAALYVVCDASERVIERVDRPRVPNMPKLQYAMPNANAMNWTLFPEETAAKALKVLDMQAPGFAPHRVIQARELVQERLEAIDRGLALLAPDELVAEDGMMMGMRP